jgi:CubicO group peptidase (beta-lactamase class C family)
MTRLIAKIFVLSCIIAVGPSFAELPTINGIPMTPDQALLGQGQKWFYHTKTSNNVAQLNYRDPNSSELKVVNQAKSLFSKNPAKAIALFNGDQIVYMDFKEPANKSSFLLSQSIAKTVNSMGVGKAICSGKLSLEDVAEKIVPELQGTDLGKSKVRDLLRMSSGTSAINRDSGIISDEQYKEMAVGRLSWLDILKTEKVNSFHQGVFNTRKTGEYFDYHSTDPILLGMILNKVTGMTYAKWIEQEVLFPAGIGHEAIIGQDRFGFGNADGGIRMTLEDWIRFANWVKKNELGSDCFANYVKEASKTQIVNAQKREGKLYDGYGYLIWTENARLKDSYWAVGYGGQRIAWNHRNQRMLVVFSNIENYMDELSWLYKDWANLE